MKQFLKSPVKSGSKIVRLLVPVGVFENPFSIMNKLVPMIEGAEEWAEDTRVFAECPGLGIGILDNA